MRSPLLLALLVTLHAAAQDTTSYNGIDSGEWPPKFELSRSPLAAAPYLTSPPKVIPIDVGRQLFVDDFLIETTTMQRTWHLPRYHDASPVLSPDQRWDKDHAAPFSDGVWFDERDQLFKMWYWARGDDEDGKPLTSTCLATSQDGLRWEKPHFDVVPGTNIVLRDDPEHIRNSSTVWLDRAEKDPAQRYKMFRVLQWKGQGRWRINYSASADGVHWKSIDDSEPVDDRTTVFYNGFRQKWVASLRSFDKVVGRFRRYHEAPDVIGMLHWKDPADWICADELDPARDDLELRRDPQRPWELTPSQLYNLDGIAYESVLLGLFSIWRGQQMPPKPKINEICVGYSRDGFHWSRPDRRPFCPVKANENAWNSGNLQSAGGCCLVVGDELRFYVGAVPKNRNFADPGNVGIAILRRDGFTSMDTREKVATLTTRNVEFKGAHLFVNVFCPEGELRAEVLDERGEVIAPFSAANCEPLHADSTRQAVKWNGAPDLSAVAGKPVKFRFHLTNGQFYAFWVSADANGHSHGFVGAGGPGFASDVDR
jgi:hypothetical protein